MILEGKYGNKTKITKNTKKILKTFFLVIFVLFTYLPSKITYENSNFQIFVFFGFFGINILELQGRLQKGTFSLSLECSRMF